MNEREVDLADFIDEDDEDLELSPENTLFTCLRGDRQAFGPSVQDAWDNDWECATACWDPWAHVELKGTVYTFGMVPITVNTP